LSVKRTGRPERAHRLYRVGSCSRRAHFSGPHRRPTEAEAMQADSCPHPRGAGSAMEDTLRDGFRLVGHVGECSEALPPRRWPLGGTAGSALGSNSASAGVVLRRSALLCVWPFRWSGSIVAGQGCGLGFMACKRSGVRIPVAPLRDISAGQRHIRGPDMGACLPSRRPKRPGYGIFPSRVSTGQRLSSHSGLGPCADSKRSRSCRCLPAGHRHGLLAGYQTGYLQAGVSVSLASTV
jgi:hypothetical protein